MRRDLVYYYPCPVGAVFNAFIQAANQKFGKDCRIVSEGKTISFGLSYSFKYNMNGGSVTAHFMPYQNGTAVDLRYTMVQLAAGRYKAHARDLTLFTNGILQARAELIQLDVNLFLEYEKNTPDMPVPQPVPQPTPHPAPAADACPNCGRPVSPGAKFCAGCGQKLTAKEFCHQCGAPMESDAAFCIRCGAKKA